MTYRPHALLRFGGRWFETEEWSCSLRLVTDDAAATQDQWISALQPNTPGGEPTMLTDVRTAVAAWFSRANSHISNKAYLDYVSLNAINSQGGYADPGNPRTYRYPLGSAPIGPATALTWPQLALVVSLRTQTQRGFGTHGRFYAPCAIASTNTGRISSGIAGAIAQSAAQLLVAISNVQVLALAGEPRVAVVSPLAGPQGSPDGHGPARIVTRVLVGDVIDTQRRRRQALKESYTAADVVT